MEIGRLIDGEPAARSTGGLRCVVALALGCKDLGKTQRKIWEPDALPAAVAAAWRACVGDGAVPYGDDEQAAAAAAVAWQLGLPLPPSLPAPGELSTPCMLLALRFRPLAPSAAPRSVRSPSDASPSLAALCRHDDLSIRRSPIW